MKTTKANPIEPEEKDPTQENAPGDVKNDFTGVLPPMNGEPPLPTPKTRKKFKNSYRNAREISSIFESM